MNHDHHVFDWCLEAIKYICKWYLPVVRLGSLYPYKTNCCKHCVLILSTHLCDECAVLGRVPSLMHTYKVPKAVWR